MCSFFAIHRQKYARNSGAKVDDPLNDYSIEKVKKIVLENRDVAHRFLEGYEKQLLEVTCSYTKISNIMNYCYVKTNEELYLCYA